MSFVGPRPERPNFVDDLADKIAEQWKLYGSHSDPSDRRLDRAIVHTENQVPFREIVAVMDALYTAKRDMVEPSGATKKVPVFNMAFAAR